MDLGRTRGGRVNVTKVLKALTQEGWGKEGYQTPGRSRLKQTTVAMESRELEEGRHGKLEIREAPWTIKARQMSRQIIVIRGENVDEHLCLT